MIRLFLKKKSFQPVKDISFFYGTANFIIGFTKSRSAPSFIVTTESDSYHYTLFLKHSSHFLILSSCLRLYLPTSFGFSSQYLQTFLTSPCLLHFQLKLSLFILITPNVLHHNNGVFQFEIFYGAPCRCSRILISW
jgi:hypothetical protein